MKKDATTGSWNAIGSGWGLFDAETGHPLNPHLLVTDEVIEMSEWELQDFAVQTVRQYLEGRGYALMSWQGSPEVNPAIWFIGDTGRPEWVGARHAIFPHSSAERPPNWEVIAASCAHMSRIGHFASVGIVSADQPFESTDEKPVPLVRGGAMWVNFPGLE
jgi:hypothetical protein